MKVNELARRAIVAAVALAAVTAASAVPSATANAGTDTGTDTGAGKGGWEVASAGAFGKDVYLDSVTAAGPNAAWATGYRVVDAQSRGLLLRWDGRRWRPEHAPGLPEVSYWLSVSAVSPHDVWAYGRVAGSTYTVAHFDGRHWRTVEPPGEEGLGGYEDAFDAVPGRVWLAAEERIRSYADGRWQTLDLGENTNVIDLDARSARDAWAVARVWQPDEEQQERYRLLVLHWDGQEWAEVPFDRLGLWPENVYVESRRSVYVLADPGSLDDGTPHLLHWDGRRWEEIDTPMPRLSSGTVDGDGHGTLWFSGSPEATHSPPVFWRYDARYDDWTRVTGEPAPDVRARNYGLNDLAAGGPYGDYWSVGTYTVTVGEGRAARRGIIYHHR